ncbi:MAG TPA: DUF1559 domain-containing protein, partial [Planctomycetaceae bacterium]|nr:DUF1559 domain-containing protein [Planctomycetaceae bacterium]
VALLLPAVQQAREAARRSSCKNNLKQIGLALHNYHEVHSLFPPGYVSTRPGTDSNSSWCRSGGVQYAPWTVLILPQLEQTPLSEKMNFNVVFQLTSNQMAPPNSDVLIPLDVYTCPSNTRATVNPLISSYFGVMGGGAAPDCGNTGCSAANERASYVSGMLFSGSNKKFKDALDGTSNVFLVGETRYADAAWGASAKQDSCSYARNLAGAQDQINLFDAPGVHGTRGFSSDHVGGCQFLMADGTVHFVSENIDITIYRTVARREDKYPTSGFQP